MKKVYSKHALLLFNLENILREQGIEGIRLSSSGGCCGPQLALTLDKPKRSDSIETINGIQVAFDKRVSGSDNFTLDIEQNQQGVGLVLLGAGGGC